MIAAFDTLMMRLLGICCASFSSGLGELTFLQLSTRYHPPAVAGHSVGYVPSTAFPVDQADATPVPGTSPLVLVLPAWSAPSYGGSCVG